MSPQPETILIITGAAGVLGRMLTEEAYNRDDTEQLVITPMTRGDRDWYQQMLARPLFYEDPRRKVLINCAGVIRDEGPYSPKEMSYVNGSLPHYLAWQMESMNDRDRIVQISTDCVFNGEDGPYYEDAQPTPMDMYGRTKLAGELTGPMYDQRNVLTIRLSFIGLGKRGWLRRFMDTEPEMPVYGFDSWMWNGLYARTAARTILDWALNDSMTGIVHLEGPIITKYQLWEMLVDRFKPEMDLHKQSPPGKNMILTSTSYANALYKPNWKDMLDELHVDWTERWSVAEEYWREANASAYHHSGSSRAI